MASFLKKWQVAAVARAASLLLAAGTVSAAPMGVEVGESSLILALDYSDTFTLAAHGGLSTRTNPPTFPAGAYVVENNYGNPARNWRDSANANYWSFNRDGSAGHSNTIAETAQFPYNTRNPAGSGANSGTGVTQQGEANRYQWIAYQNEQGGVLRPEYMVQVDATLTYDRVMIASHSTANATHDSTGQGAGTLSVFFRQGNVADGVNAGLGIHLAGSGFPEYQVLTQAQAAAAGLGRPAEWHNLAVWFGDDFLRIYVNENEVAHVDLTNVAGNDWSNYGRGHVGYGYLAGSTGSRFWSDNFQVGQPIPEPAAISLLGLAGLALIRRRR